QIINIPWGSGATSYSAKTDAMLQAADACLYEMPGAQVYGRQGKLVDLSTLIKKDKHFKNVWGAQLDTSRSWGPKNPNSLFFIPPLVANPNLRARFRTSFNLRGANGHGGVNTVSPLSMASNCNNKAAAWTALKWLAGAPAAETYYFQAAGRVPVTTGSWRKVPGLAALPDAKVIVGQPQQADPVYPWAAQ